MKLNCVLFVLFNFELYLSAIGLSIKSIQLYNYHNAKNSNTQKFRTVNSSPNSDLILRRGNTFTVTISLSREYISKTDEVFVHFNFGNFPTYLKRSSVVLRVLKNTRFYENAKKNPNRWHTDLYKINNKDLTFDIYLPVDLPVGEWYMQAFCKYKGQVTNSYNVKNNIYILFNAWSKSDPVYLPNEEDRQEYVLNDIGRIYTGNRYSKEYRDWYFEQFNKGMLKAIMYVMSKSDLSPVERSDIVATSRAISAITNSNDENGVIVGGWMKHYNKPYKNAWEWLGSSDIILKYYRENGTPVRYGQCWVFAGVATTIARALGIPARPVTAYSAGHDEDKSLTIDQYFDSNGEEIKKFTKDSIWNFHVWVELWFKRNDIRINSSSFNKLAESWQAIDGTPQEIINHNRYEIGPAQVGLIRYGDLSAPYDLSYLYGEVNSDIHRYHKINNRFVRQRIETDKTGTTIICKGPGNLILDLTSNYKYKEGTREERASYKRALKMVKLFYSPEFNFEQKMNVPEDVFLKVVFKEKYYVGEPIKLRLKLINTANSTRNAFIKLVVNLVTYNAIVLNKINNFEGYVKLRPNEFINKDFIVDEKLYLNKLTEIGNLKLTTYIKVNETESASLNDYIIVLKKPELNIRTETQTLELNKANKIYFTMLNPLNSSLKNCKILIKNELISDSTEISPFNVEPKKYFSYFINFKPSEVGEQMMIASLNCDELKDIRANLKFNVQQLNNSTVH